MQSLAKPVGTATGLEPRLLSPVPLSQCPNRSLRSMQAESVVRRDPRSLLSVRIRYIICDSMRDMQDALQAFRMHTDWATSTGSMIHVDEEYGFRTVFEMCIGDSAFRGLHFPIASSAGCCAGKNADDDSVEGRDALR